MCVRLILEISMCVFVRLTLELCVRVCVCLNVDVWLEDRALLTECKTLSIQYMALLIEFRAN